MVYVVLWLCRFPDFSWRVWFEKIYDTFQASVSNFSILIDLFTILSKVDYLFCLLLLCSIRSINPSMNLEDKIDLA